MNTLLICGSPKRKGGASRYFMGLLAAVIRGKTVCLPLRGRQDYEKLLERLPQADRVVFSLPLYIDCIPSHVMAFLQELEVYAKERGLSIPVYVVCNSGFIEGKQTAPVMDIFENLCKRAGLKWGGGLGIGGGVMLQVLRYVFWLYGVLLVVSLLVSGIQGGNWLSGAVFLSWGENMLWLLFLHLGVLTYGLGLAHCINRSKPYKNRYTRVMLPSFLFILVADVFFVLCALLKGTTPWALCKKR